MDLVDAILDDQPEGHALEGLKSSAELLPGHRVPVDDDVVGVAISGPDATIRTDQTPRHLEADEQHPAGRLAGLELSASDARLCDLAEVADLGVDRLVMTTQRGDRLEVVAPSPASTSSTPVPEGQRATR